MGDFDLQPLSTSVQNLLNSQIKLCFILHGRNHVTCISMNTQMMKNITSLESKNNGTLNCQICKSVKKQYTACSLL